MKALLDGANYAKGPLVKKNSVQIAAIALLGVSGEIKGGQYQRNRRGLSFRQMICGDVTTFGDDYVPL